MIISRTPFRISFFGGGTDYPDYFKDEPGSVLVTTIDKYLYLTARWLPPFFDFKYRIVYSKVEDVDEIKLIQHPSVRETFKFLKIGDGVEIHPASDLPARTGLGSSSAFTVGLLNALGALTRNKKDVMKLAQEAIYIEQVMCGDVVGCQDQIACSIGGLNRVNFEWVKDKNGVGPKYTIEKVRISQQRIKDLEDRLLLFFTGFSRNAPEIASHQVKNIPKKKKELKIMHKMVDKAIDILHTGSLDEFGMLMHDSWMLKRTLSDKISNPHIDAFYSSAIAAGATGGKLLGAGGGGFLLLYVEPSRQESVRNVFKDLVEVPFRFENTGTEIIVDSEYDNGK